LAKVTYTGGRKPKGLNKIDKLAKVTYTGVYIIVDSHITAAFKKGASKILMKLTETTLIIY
jgi:hypothetical protein